MSSSTSYPSSELIGLTSNVLETCWHRAEPLMMEEERTPGRAVMELVAYALFTFSPFGNMPGRLKVGSFLLTKHLCNHNRDSWLTQVLHKHVT